MSKRIPRNNKKTTLFTVEQKGNCILLRNNQSEKEIKKMTEKLSNNYPIIKQIIKQSISEIRSTILKYDPIELLNYTYAALCAHTITKKSDEVMPIKILEYIQSIIVSSPKSLSHDKISDADYNKLANKIENLYRNVMLCQTCLRAYRKQHGCTFDNDLEELYFSLTNYWLIVRGSRYMFFDIPFLETILKPHQEIIEKTYNININDIRDGLKDIQHRLSKRYLESCKLFHSADALIGEELKKHRIESINEAHCIVKKFWENNPIYKSAFIDFTQMKFVELGENFIWPSSLMDDLSYSPGEDVLFSEEPNSFWPIKNLPIIRKPFLKHNNNYYCYNLYALFDNFYRKINELIIINNPGYREVWNKKQKEISEKLPLIYLKKVLPSSVSFSGVAYRVGAGNWAEYDALLEYNGLLFVIEVKAGKYDPESPYDDFEGHLRSIKDLILKPAKQASRFINLLKERKSIEICNSNHLKLRDIRYNDYHSIIPLCVTLESMTFLNSTVSNFKSVLEDHDENNKMWAISLDDLMVVVDLFENNPIRFCHYAKIRWNFAKNSQCEIHDEIEHVGLYYFYNNYLKMIEYKYGIHNINKLTFNGFSKTIDDYYSDIAINNYDKSKVTLITPKTTLQIEELLKILQKFLSPSLIEGVCYFLDYSITEQDIIATRINKLISETKHTRDNKFAIDNRNDQKVVLIATFYDYEEKINSINNDIKLYLLEHNLEILYFFSFKILKDGFAIPKIEIFTRQMILENIKNKETKLTTDLPISEFISLFPRKEKVGRNDPCPCGSGLKYKKCCLNNSH